MRQNLTRDGDRMTLAYADAHAALLDDLDARVRETVRRDGVDPQAEVAAVRRIAERVVSTVVVSSCRPCRATNTWLGSLIHTSSTLRSSR